MTHTGIPTSSSYYTCIQPDDDDETKGEPFLAYSLGHEPDNEEFVTTPSLINTTSGIDEQMIDGDEQSINDDFFYMLQPNIISKKEMEQWNQTIDYVSRTILVQEHK